MYIKKKLSALLLAAALTVSSVSPAFAVESPTTGSTPTTTVTTNPSTGEVEFSTTSGQSTVSGEIDGKDVIVNKAKSTKKKNAVLNLAYVKTKDGEKKTVTKIAKGAIKGKQKKKTLKVNNVTRFLKGFLSKGARNNTEILEFVGKKLKAKQFKNAFAGYPGKIVFSKKVMSNKQFKKLRNMLNKEGFKGTLSRR